MKQPFWHQTTIGRLESILKYGLLSKNCAVKMGIKNYRRISNSSWNDDYVSLMANTDPRQATSPGVAILVDPNIKVIPAGKYEETDINRPVPNEVLAKDKINPDKFVGLVIGEVGYSFRLEKYVKPKPMSLNKVVEALKMSKTNLPVYFKGEQVWPKQ